MHPAAGVRTEQDGRHDWLAVRAWHDGGADGSAGPGRGEGLAVLLTGPWRPEGGSCAKPVTLWLSGDVLRVTDHTGHTDTERVLDRRSTGLVTEVVRSRHGVPAGTRTVYEVLGPAQVSATDAATQRSSGLQRCPDPLPADLIPRQVVETIYARNATPNQVGTPFDSEAALRQFLVPALADSLNCWMAYRDVPPDGCVGNYDPFVPEFRDGVSEGRFKADDEVEGCCFVPTWLPAPRRSSNPALDRTQGLGFRPGRDGPTRALQMTGAGRQAG